MKMEMICPECGKEMYISAENFKWLCFGYNHGKRTHEAVYIEPKYTVDALKRMISRWQKGGLKDYDREATHTEGDNILVNLVRLLTDDKDILNFTDLFTKRTRWYS